MTAAMVGWLVVVALMVGILVAAIIRGVGVALLERLHRKRLEWARIEAEFLSRRDARELVESGAPLSGYQKIAMAERGLLRHWIRASFNSRSLREADPDYRDEELIALYPNP